MTYDGSRIETQNEMLGWPLIDEGGTFVVEQRRDGVFGLMALFDNRKAAQERIWDALDEHHEHTLLDYRLSVWTVLSEWPDTTEGEYERVPA